MKPSTNPFSPDYVSQIEMPRTPTFKVPKIKPLKSLERIAPKEPSKWEDRGPMAAKKLKASI
jgi:hypothetical protein